jgi:hypothetical protein
MRTFATILALLGTLLVPATTEAQEQAWLHLHAIEDADSEVRLNFPATMIGEMLESVGGSLLEELDSGNDPSLADARRMWAAMRNAGDVEILNAQDDDGSVRIYREGNRVFVDAVDGDETAQVEMPVAIADALFAEEPSGPQLQAAIEELVRQGGSDLLVIRDGSSTVRLWVDDRPDQN